MKYRWVLGVLCVYCLRSISPVDRERTVSYRCVPRAARIYIKEDPAKGPEFLKVLLNPQGAHEFHVSIGVGVLERKRVNRKLIETNVKHHKAKSIHTHIHTHRGLIHKFEGIFI